MKLRVALKVSGRIWGDDPTLTYRLVTITRAIRRWQQYAKRHAAPTPLPDDVAGAILELRYILNRADERN